MPKVAGIDGCRGGWLLAVWDPERGHFEAEVMADWTSLRRCAALDGVALCGVDMPIGLADEGPRACDLAARALLPKGRKSSVFPPPRRYMLACRDWAEAQALGRWREGKGLSKETWNITGKIKELDRHITPADQERIIEVHPELAFHRLSNGVALPRKRLAEGEAARLDLLRRAGLPDLAPWLARTPRKIAKPDDVIDAAACAWVASRALAGAALRLPEGRKPPLDSRSLRMEIWC